MAKSGFKILDSDMHIMEPPDLWERYIDRKFKARAPRGVTSTNVRDLRMVYPDGREEIVLDVPHRVPPTRILKGLPRDNARITLFVALAKVEVPGYVSSLISFSLLYLSRQERAVCDQYSLRDYYRLSLVII